MQLHPVADHQPHTTPTPCCCATTPALQVLLEIPGDLGITSVDVEKNPALAALAAGRSELVGLALWLMAERAKVGSGVEHANLWPGLGGGGLRMCWGEVGGLGGELCF